ncbi:MAG TPA: hypothetical protein VM531_11225 [Sphingomicrobium sp.]|jgi:hypothetical protein|nr:hypothetical protein [Sphingomicrobium sp.]
MNWTNYDRLVAHLKAMPPGEFDYSSYFNMDRGCVACQCVRLGAERNVFGTADSSTIREFLDVTVDESHLLFVSALYWDPYSGVTLGRLAIANALHRLATVAQRYERPPADREQAFLRSVRDLAKEPVS